MPEVTKAQPYDPSRMGSLGDAAHMLIRQCLFPLEYDADERFTSADSDRLLSWDYERFRRVLKEHLGTGECGIADWARATGNADVMSFIIDALNARKKNIKWTGYRIVYTVHRANGFPICSLQLFAKRKGSDTKVYSEGDAPNVEAREITRMA